MSPLAPTRGPAERTRARSGDALLLAQLHAAPWHGVVHSVFERVVNVVPGHGSLFVLAVRSVDDAPDTLVLDLEDWPGCGVGRGDGVRGCAGEIVLGERVVIATAGAVAWRPVLPAYPRHPDRLGANLAVLREHLRDVHARRARSPATDRAGELLVTALQRLAAAWAAGNQQAAITAARSLVGLGPGLTPSGDDILLGLFAAWRLPGHPGARLARRDGEILRDVDLRTNAISAAALRAAAAGRVRESIAALLRELVQGTPHSLRAPLHRVLSIGSSSGADIAHGIAAGLSMAAPRSVQR